MPIRTLAFGAACVLLVAYACAFTQPATDHPKFGQFQAVGKSSRGELAQPSAGDASVSQAPMTGAATFAIARVDTDGTIVLRPADNFQLRLQDSLGGHYAEGFYLLVTNDSNPAGKRRVLRVQLTDVDGSVFTLKAGPRAAARVQVNDQARLVRPVPVSTAKLRALPDEILIEGSAPDHDAGAGPRESAARRRSINNLKQIGLAMHNFHSVHNQFPPAVIFGPDGKPWHSWRVLILPFIEQAGVYNAYDFGQPWDSPKNKALFDKMPDVYRDPIYGDTNEPYTNYAAFVGPNAIFRPAGAKQTDLEDPPIGKGGRGLQNITDGSSNTLMVSSIEPARRVLWTKPEDIDAGPAFRGLGQPGGVATPYTFLGPGGGKTAPFLFADGSVRVIGSKIHPHSCRADLR